MHALPQQPEPPTPLLQQRPFRMLIFSRFWSGVAQNALNFALVLLVVEETDRAFLSSLLVLALVVPSTLAGIVAGASADILPKRPQVALAEWARAGVCILFARSSGGAEGLFFVAAALATVGQFAGSARGTILPAIVRRDDLAKANATAQAITGVAQVIGLGVLTPLTLRLAGEPDILFFACAVMFVLSGLQALLIGKVEGRDPPAIGGGGREGRWWTVGWRYLRSDPVAMHAAVELTLISMALIILGGLIPGFISDVMGLPVDVGAIILLPAALGVVLGLRLAGFLAHRVRHTFLSTAGFVGFVVTLLLVTFAGPEAEFLAGYGLFGFLGRISIGSFDGGGALTMLLMLPLGFAYATAAVAAQTLLNARVPLSLQGRVMATEGAMSAAAASLPVLGAGALSDVVGVTPVMALLALSIGAAAVLNLRQPRAAEYPAPAVP